jgi:hypothetical protein
MDYRLRGEARSMNRRLAAIATAALLLSAATPAISQTVTAPQAAPSAPPMGYYIMQGSRIVSPPFANVAACTKALANVQKTTAPGNDTLVCAHRRP